MKKIGIVTEETSLLEPVVKFFFSSQEEYHLESMDPDSAVAATAMLAAKDMIIYDFSSLSSPNLNTFVTLMRGLPYIPCLAVLQAESDLQDKVLQAGATELLFRPLDDKKLISCITQVLEHSSIGQIKGIAIINLLQLLEGDEKNCTLQVESGRQRGLIFIENGAVISAETADQEGEDALYNIISWEKPHIELRHYNGQKHPTIHKPLMALIMEGVRLKDERESLIQQYASNKRVKLELKHISTFGNRIPLDIGSTLKIELEGCASPLTSALVGMVPDQYLIVEMPPGSDSLFADLDPENAFIIKYLYLGRLCLFKTEIQHILNKDYSLLFLDYPRAIYYHELRRAKRTTIYLPSILKFPGQGEGDFHCLIVDLSVFGCLCQMKGKGNVASLPKFELNRIVSLHCVLPGLSDRHEIRGKVRNISKSEEEIRLGLEFMGLPPQVKAAVASYVRSIELSAK